MSTSFVPCRPECPILSAVIPPTSDGESGNQAAVLDWKSRHDWGVITFDNSGGWKPKSERSVPPSICDQMGRQIASIFAIAFNQAAHAIAKNRWAVVTARGTVIILSGIPLTDRPLNPAALPKCAQSGLTFEQAEQAVNEANRERFRLATIPREWSVTVSPADLLPD